MSTNRIGPFQPMTRSERDRSIRKALVARPDGPVQIFAYGSLLWRPCFNPAASRSVTLAGFARRFSIWTVEARGSPEAPGLGLALEPGAASCEGVLLEVCEDTEADDLQQLWAREMYTGVYRPVWVAVAGTNGGARALTFVANPDHPQYAGARSMAEQARYIATAAGQLGPCADYLRETVQALRALGIVDAALEGLHTEVVGYSSRTGAC